jgi:hypothetical protein
MTGARASRTVPDSGFRFPFGAGLRHGRDGGREARRVSATGN